MRIHEIVCESAPVNAQSFQEALRSTLKAMMVGVWTSPEKINQGMCGEFAAQVMKRFGLELWGKSPTLRSTNTKWYYGDDDNTMDLDRLREMGEPVPEGIDERKLAYELGSVHYWLCFEGRHYDAECLGGTDHFLNLPFFQNIIARLR
jgi:hypothetical protein